MCSENYLVFEQFCVGYGKAPLVEIDGVSVKKGGAVALLGPNGSGKSTVLKTMAGVISPVSGRFLLGDQFPLSLSSVGRSRNIAYLPQVQEVDAFLTVRELVALGRTPYLGALGTLKESDNAVVDRTLEICDLLSLMHRSVSQISGGELQRARLAMTLAQEAPLLLLDEPTNHMDVRHRYNLYQILADAREQFGITVMMVCHCLNDALNFAEHVLLLDGNECVEYASADAAHIKAHIVSRSCVPENWVF